MKGSRRSMLGAVVLFVLIAGSVVGGVTWASVSSYQLAKKTVSEEHRTHVLRALSHIESHMTWILNSETARPATDYVDRYTVQPDFVITDDGRHLDPDTLTVKLPSSIARSGPPHVWMDLYFQVHPDGTLTSPQIAEQGAAWPVESVPNAAPSEWRARLAWGWFERLFSQVDLREQMAKAACCVQSEDDLDAGGASLASQSTADPKQSAEERRDGRSSSPRPSSFVDVQRDYVPTEECVNAIIVEGNIRTTSSQTGDVQISTGPFGTPFWIEGAPDATRKLAFVRECWLDAAPFYQGFVGDWERLKPELLNQIHYLFPEADLEPIVEGTPLNEAARALKPQQLPVILRVPDIPGGTAAAAWTSVRNQLLISWVAAAAVLIVAGWGVSNLVALTERRMQFAYAVTHELRTPLTTFRLYSDMLSAGLVPEHAKQEYLDTLNRESIRLSKLVEGVLEYARLENHKVNLHLTDTDGISLLREVGETLERRCEENGVAARLENGLAPSKRLRTDVNLVNQIAGVLVNNACRHARGSKNPTVLVALNEDNGKIHLEVVDSGNGVELADSRRIFRPFRRGSDADKAARGGVGLGLALARNWAGLLGGKLELVARHHPQLHGAHFRLTIPVNLKT